LPTPAAQFNFCYCLAPWTGSGLAGLAWLAWLASDAMVHGISVIVSACFLISLPRRHLSSWGFSFSPTLFCLFIRL